MRASASEARQIFARQMAPTAACLLTFTDLAVLLCAFFVTYSHLSEDDCTQTLRTSVPTSSS